MISFTPFSIERIPTVAHIQSVVAAYHRLKPEDMRSSRRSRRVAWPRQTAMYLTRELTPKSLPNIGRLFGNRDHTTVMHAIAAVERRIEADCAVAADVKLLRQALVGAVDMSDNSQSNHTHAAERGKEHSMNSQQEMAA